MAEIINLRAVRKARSRTEAAKAADASRAHHGQTKAAKALAKAEVARTLRLIDGAKRETD